MSALANAFLKEQLCRLAIPRFGQVEVNRLSISVDGAEQVHPAASDSNKRLVHVPSRRFPFNSTVQAPIHLRTVPLSPTPDRCVVHCQAALRHEFLQIAQAQAKTEVPPYAGYDHFWCELPLPERRRPARPHALTLTDPQLQHCPCACSVLLWRGERWKYGITAIVYLWLGGVTLHHNAETKSAAYLS